MARRELLLVIDELPQSPPFVAHLREPDGTFFGPKGEGRTIVEALRGLVEEVDFKLRRAGERGFMEDGNG